MTGSLESTKWWLVAWRPQGMMIAGDKYVWEKNLKTSKTLWSTKRDTTSTSNDNPGLPQKIGITRKQSEIGENLGLPENSQRLATPRSKTARFSPTTLAENEGCHSKKWLIKGPVQSSNKKDSQSDAVYIYVLYSFTVVRLLVYPVPKPSPPGKLLNFTEIHW